MAAISALMIEGETSHREKHDDENTPTTPRPTVRIQSPRPTDVATIVPEAESVPMLSSDLSVRPEDNNVQESPSDKDIDKQKVLHKRSNSDAMEMDDSAEEDEGSDNEDGQHEDETGARKKKGQRFFCTGYPPCNLSFTRSEHLARHIRKHTGERPFQCHCNRRFSRLDNLRQHAQTVHVNEEIPTDSLAATGTRYQRQIRTDRVRPAPKPRTSTTSSSGSHSRGHSRNLSTSSIGSTSSIYSNATDARRRPPPLLMAGDNRPTTPPTYSNYAAHSPADLTTPTSTTFPGTPGSPGFASTLTSPVATHSRGGSFLGDARTPGRRLSVPSSINPFQHVPHPYQYSATYGPGPAVPNTPTSSIVTSPTSPVLTHGSNMPVSSAEDWRRRTWHPSTYQNISHNYNRPATSGLTYSQTPDAPQPAYAQNAMSAAGQAPRLPGIESFDHVQHRPTTPPRRNPASSQSLMAAPEIRDPRRGHISHVSWDGSRRSQYPEIDDNGRPTTSWGQDTLQQLDELRDTQARQFAVAPEPAVMGPPMHTVNAQHHQQMAKEALDLQTSASKRIKRSGGYNGSHVAYRTSPESSSSDGIPTPGTSVAEIHPTILHSNGYIEPQLLVGEAQHTPCLASPMSPPQSFHSSHEQSHAYTRTGTRRDSNLDRLEALVAVATGETARR
ncbi:Up in starvation [Lithohypha guttulata]|nr:Up in starvation [Lithohypha guttulata]